MFLQLHTLHAYGPNNLNRDDMGRPKTVVIGGSTRQRISSQSLKSWWRRSDVFRNTVDQLVGIRTRRIGPETIAYLKDRKIPEARASEIAAQLVALWSGDKPKASPKKTRGKAAAAEGDEAPKAPAKKDVICLFAPAEWDRAMKLAEQMARGKVEDISAASIFTGGDTAVDLALWGRMLAAAPQHSVTAACSVAHAHTTHAVTVEQDYFTARDDRADVSSDQGAGAGHVDVRHFGSGVFYGYCCLDLRLLRDNLGKRADLAPATVEALIRAVATVSPGAMQSTMASHAYASYALAELGTHQPRTMQAAYVKPVRSSDYLKASVAALEAHRALLDRVYGPSCDKTVAIDTTGESALAGSSTLADVVKLGREGATACAV